MESMAKVGMVFSASQFETIVKSASHIAGQECKAGLLDGWATREQRHDIWDIFERMDVTNVGALKLEKVWATLLGLACLHARMHTCIYACA